MFINYFVKHQVDSSDPRKHLFQPWNMFDVGRFFCSYSLLRKASFTHFTHTDTWSNEDWRIDLTVAIVFSEKQRRTQLSFFWIGQKLWEENPFQFGGCINHHHIDIWCCPINKNRGPIPTRSTRKSCSTSPFSGALWGPRLWWCRHIRAVAGFTMWVKNKGKPGYKNGLKYRLCWMLTWSRRCIWHLRS